MTNTAVTILPKITQLQANFVKLYLETGIVKHCAEQLQTPIPTLYGWLELPKIKRHLQHYRAKTAPKCPFTAQDVALEAGRIAFQDIKDTIPGLKYDIETGEAFVTAQDWAQVDGRLIKSVKQDIKDGISIIKLEFWDKIAALRLLQEHFRGSETDKHVHVHLTAEDLEKRDIHGANDAYHELMSD